jgi:MFS family permease
MTLPEPPRGPASETCPILKLLTVPAFLAMIAGGICITFSCVSILTWGVDFAVAYKEFSLRQASVWLAVIGSVCSLCGVLFGGFVADRLQRRFTFGRIIAIAVAFLFAAPFVLLAIQTDDRTLVLAALALASFFMSWYHGPVTAVIHDMMPRRAHASSIGVYMFVTQLVGAFGPKLVGRISDLHDMQLALQIAVAVMVAGGLLMFLVIHFIRRDGLQHSCLDSFRAEPGD